MTVLNFTSSKNTFRTRKLVQVSRRVTRQGKSIISGFGALSYL